MRQKAVDLTGKRNLLTLEQKELAIARMNNCFLKLNKIVKGAFDWLLKIENRPHCRLGCKQYYQREAEKLRWTKERATKKSFRA